MTSWGGLAVPDRMTSLDRASVASRLGRTDVVLRDEISRTAIILDVVCRTEDITFWHGGRTLGIVARISFTGWLWNGGCLVHDDLAWTMDRRGVWLTVNGHRSYPIDEKALLDIASLIANSG